MGGNGAQARQKEAQGSRGHAEGTEANKIRRILQHKLDVQVKRSAVVERGSIIFDGILNEAGSCCSILLKRKLL